MQRMIVAASAAALALVASAPGWGQERPVMGDEAVAIVTEGTIRASSSEGFQGFLLLIEHRDKNYTCAVTAKGQVQECYPLYW